MDMNTGWSKTTRGLIFLMATVFLVWLLWTIRTMVGPLVIAALLAYLLHPVVTLLEKHTALGRRRSVYIVYVLFLVVLLATIISMVPVVGRQARSLAHEIPSYMPKLEETFQPIDFLGVAVPFDELWEDLQSSSAQLFKPDRIFRVINAASTNLAWILVILVTTFYLLQDWERLVAWIIHLAPQTLQADLNRLHQEITVIWGAYLRGQLLIMFLIGIFSGLGAAGLGLPRALLLGFLAGLLALFPSIGPAFATTIAALVAWFDGSNFLDISNFWITLLTIGVFSGVQFIEGVWLQPNIMSHRLRLHPGLVFVTLVGALAFGSALLALIIIPLLASFIVLGRYLHRQLLNLEPWSSNQDIGLANERVTTGKINL